MDGQWVAFDFFVIYACILVTYCSPPNTQPTITHTHTHTLECSASALLQRCRAFHFLLELRQSGSLGEPKILFFLMRFLIFVPFVIFFFFRLCLAERFIARTVNACGQDDEAPPGVVVIEVISLTLPPCVLLPIHPFPRKQHTHR